MSESNLVVQIEWGDFSHDGHNQTGNFHVEVCSNQCPTLSELELKGVLEIALQKAEEFCEEHGILTGYEERVITEDQWGAIEAKGIALPVNWGDDFDRAEAFYDGDEATDLLLAMVNHFIEVGLVVRKVEGFPAVTTGFGYACFV